MFENYNFNIYLILISIFRKIITNDKLGITTKNAIQEELERQLRLQQTSNNHLLDSNINLLKNSLENDESFVKNNGIELNQTNKHNNNIDNVVDNCSDNIDEDGKNDKNDNDNNDYKNENDDNNYNENYDDNDDSIQLIDDDIKEDSIKNDDNDDCLILSENERQEEEQQNCEKVLTKLHLNDKYNVSDSNGRVLVNVNHPSEDIDIFLPAFIAKHIKPHQIGGIRFMYDNVIESMSRVKDKSIGFGCILAHAMGLGIINYYCEFYYGK